MKTSVWYHKAMSISLNTIVLWLVTYRYVVLLPFAIIEGPIVSIIAGALVAIGQFNFWIAYGLLAVGDVIGDIALYALGRWGRNGFILKYGPIFGVTPERIEKLEKFFGEHAKKTLLFGKWGHAFGLPVLLAAGAAKEPFGEFITMSVVGTLPKTLALLLIGFYFGESFALINRYIGYAAIGIVVLTIILFVGYRISAKATKKYFIES
jgi:membrane protein DedA with SNARE-associated domain